MHIWEMRKTGWGQARGTKPFKKYFGETIVHLDLDPLPPPLPLVNSDFSGPPRGPGTLNFLVNLGPNPALYAPPLTPSAADAGSGGGGAV
jgi:hypothetical protein